MSDTILIVPREIARRYASNYRHWLYGVNGRTPSLDENEEMWLAITIERAIRESRLSAEAVEEIAADAEADRVREHEGYDQ